MVATGLLLAVGWSWCGCPAVGIGASPLTFSMLRLMYTVADPAYPDPSLMPVGEKS